MSNVELIAEVAPDLWVAKAPIGDLREQDVNAHTMAPRTFERLVANIKKRGAPESLAYCAQPGGEGPVEIVSGHHRTRAAQAAGLTEVHFLLDRGRMTRSELVAKQLAHNFLVGNDDPDVVKQLMGTIDNPDHLLMTGAPDDVLPTSDREQITLFAPRVDFDWRTVSFAVLPHQEAEMKELCERLKDRHDLLLAVMPDQFDAFLKAAASYGRIKDIRSGGAIVAVLTEVALDAEREAADEQAGDDDGEGRGNWTDVTKLLEAKAIPTEAAKVVERCIVRMRAEGVLREKNAWQILEYLAADYLAGQGEEVVADAVAA